MEEGGRGFKRDATQKKAQRDVMRGRGSKAKTCIQSRAAGRCSEMDSPLEAPEGNPALSTP